MRSTIKALLLLATALVAGGCAALGLAGLLAGLDGHVGLGPIALPVGWALGLALTALAALLLVSPATLTLRRLVAWLGGRGGLAVRGDGLTLAGLVAAAGLLPLLGLARCQGEAQPLVAAEVELAQVEPVEVEPAEVEPGADPARPESPPDPPAPACADQRRQVLRDRSQVLAALVGSSLSCEAGPKGRLVLEDLEVDLDQACRLAGPIDVLLTDSYASCDAAAPSAAIQGRWRALGQRLQELPVGLRPVRVAIAGRADQRPASRCKDPTDNEALAFGRAAHVQAALLTAGGALDHDWTQRLVPLEVELPAGCAAGDASCLARQRSTRLSLHLGPSLTLDPTCPLAPLASGE